MKSSKTLVLVVVAIGCGLVAAYLTARLTAHPTTNTELVWVATQKIPQGTMLKDPDKLFAQQEMIAGTAKNAVGDLEAYKGKMVSRTIQPGQWVTAEDLSANAGISIPEGYQAMAIKISADTAAGGFILPGSRVNVVATIREQNQKTKVQVILQDQLVLAVDQNAARPDGSQAIGTVNTALLAVKPKEAEKLTLAMSLGELRLVLRSPDDKSKTRSDPLTSLNGGEDNGNFGADGEKLAGPAPVKELPRVLVAREDVKPGTKVDDPAKFFEAKEWSGLLPDKALTPADLDGLKDKVVKVAVLKNSALSTSHFEGDLAVASAAAAKKPEVPQHVLIIQNGGKEPTMTVYKDGQAVENTANQPEPPK
jgi:Flp pilus assembly protein CpaB